MITSIHFDVQEEYREQDKRDVLLGIVT